jgi:hypothetical protein
MLYERPSLRRRIKRTLLHRNATKVISQIIAGVHDGHGIAHRVAPARSSASRRSPLVGPGH